MKDLTNNTFVIPYYHDSDTRFENLKHVLRFLNKHFKTNVILGEQDTSTTEGLAGDFSNLCFEFCKIPEFKEIDVPAVEKEGRKGSLFHFTKLVNKMVKNATTPFVTILGCDNIVNQHQIVRAFEMLEMGICKVCYPFSKPTTDLPEEFKHMLQFHEYDIPKLDKYLVYQYASGAVMFGNCIIYERQLFMDVGGYNEDFVSWGSEDTEMYYRCFNLGVPMARVDGFVCHLAHPRAVNSCDANPYRENNKRICEEVKNMDGLQTLAYVRETKSRGQMI